MRPDTKWSQSRLANAILVLTLITSTILDLARCLIAIAVDGFDQSRYLAILAEDGCGVSVGVLFNANKNNNGEPTAISPAWVALTVSTTLPQLNRRRRIIALISVVALLNSHSGIELLFELYFLAGSQRSEKQTMLAAAPASECAIIQSVPHEEPEQFGLGH